MSACVFVFSLLYDILFFFVRPFEEFQVWGDNAGPEYDWDDKSRMFLPKTYNRGFVRPLQVGTPHTDQIRRSLRDSIPGAET